MLFGFVRRISKFLIFRNEWNPFIFQMKPIGGIAVFKEVEVGFRDEKSPKYIRGTISRLVQSEQLVIVCRVENCYSFLFLYFHINSFHFYLSIFFF